MDARYCDVDLVQPGILHLYEVLGGLKACGDQVVPEDDVGDP